MSSPTISPPLQDSKRGELLTRLFRELQIARFNELYYQRRADWFRHLTTAANIVSALAASAVLAKLLANSQLFGWGPAAWQILAFVAAISAVAPVLGFETKGSQMEKAALGHAILKDRLARLLSDLKSSELGESHIARSQEIESFASALAALDEAPAQRLVEKCWERALQEFPSDQAWNIV
jgi:hypothetical protein